MTMRGLARIAVGAMTLALAIGACTTGASPGASGGGGDKPGTGKTVNIAVNPWVGYEANAAIVGYLLEHELGYTVEYKNLKEEVSWQGFANGDVDVVLENWGHPDLVAKYIDEQKVAVDAGTTGNVGLIGWFVPPWLATEHPDVLDWNNLNKYASDFKTSESGDLGQLLDGDPSYVSYDEELVKNLKLNFKVVYTGSEAALIEAFKTAEEQKKWLLGYFYEPQVFLAQVPLKRVTLPPFEKGCNEPESATECDYEPLDLNKIASKKFADEGGAAYELVKNFKWTNEDQNAVADLLSTKYAGDSNAYEKAAEEWTKANEAKWKAWIPGS
jgi:glycine betaine/proline transport system substrate-binding protein